MISDYSVSVMFLYLPLNDYGFTKVTAKIKC